PTVTYATSGAALASPSPLTVIVWSLVTSPCAAAPGASAALSAISASALPTAAPTQRRRALVTESLPGSLTSPFGLPPAPISRGSVTTAWYYKNTALHRGSVRVTKLATSPDGRPDRSSLSAAPAPSRCWRAWPPRFARAVCLGLLLLPALVRYPTLTVEDRIRAEARPYQFDLVTWEAAQLQTRLPGVLQQLRVPPPPDTPIASAEDAATIREFFDAVARWRAARAANASADAAAALRAAWEAQRAATGAAIERAIGALASQQGLTADTPLGALLLPPPSFAVSEPPRVLVVSPRDHVEVAQSILLQPDVPLVAAEALEREVDGLGMSGLVVPIGGIATYPAIVPLQSSAVETLSAVAHEWLHGYLFFRPLGRAYFTSYDARTLNETVADLAGREL